LDTTRDMLSLRICAFFYVALAVACTDVAQGAKRDAGSTDSGPNVHVTGVALRVTDAQANRPIGCKLQFRGLGATPTPRWSASAEEDALWPDQYGLPLNHGAFAIGNAVFAFPCEVTVPLVPGRYHMSVSHGIAYDTAEKDLTVCAKCQSSFDTTLARVFNPTSWACGDFHAHSMPSFDCDVSVDQRMLSAVAEGLDLFAATDHDIVIDWQKPLASSGLPLTILPGVEVTTDTWANPANVGHFNIFPLSRTFEPFTLERDFVSVPEMVRQARSANEQPVIVQVNHPRLSTFSGYFEVTAFDRNRLDNAVEVLSLDFDTLEVWNGREYILYGFDHTPGLLQDWYALLNAGKRVVATGDSDTHGLASSIFGYPRTCLRVPRSRSGAVAAEDVVQALRDGNAVVTSGPWIEASLAGQGPGDLAQVQSEAVLDVVVQAPNWAPVDRLLVVVNGEVAATRAIDALPYKTNISLQLTRDSWVVVLVDGSKGALGPIPPDTVLPMPSMAFTNPIFTDFDGDGQWTAPLP
jgi:hypothetical protein